MYIVLVAFKRTRKGLESLARQRDMQTISEWIILFRDDSTFSLSDGMFVFLVWRDALFET